MTHVLGLLSYITKHLTVLKFVFFYLEEGLNL